MGSEVSEMLYWVPDVGSPPGSAGRLDLHPVQCHHHRGGGQRCHSQTGWVSQGQRPAMSPSNWVSITEEAHLGAADWAPLIGCRRLGARQLGAVPFGRRTFGRRFELWRKNNEAGNSLNAVEREPIPTRVLNPNASEASYKLKKRS